MSTHKAQPATVFDVLTGAQQAERATFRILDEHENLDACELWRRIESRAAALVARKVERGDRVLVSAPNEVQTVVDILAVMRLGAIPALMNPQATVRECRAYAEVVQPRLVVADQPEAWKSFQTVQSRDCSPDYKTLPALPQSDEPALILFTSGTTGMPKAAVHLHRTLVYAGQGLAYWLDLSREDVILLCMPLFHANAIFYSLMGGLCARSAINIVPRFSVSRFWDMVRSSNATEVNLLAPMLSMLVRTPVREDDADHNLRLVYTAGASPQMLNEFQTRFGVTVVEGYGMTETPYGCINPLASPRPSSVGPPRQHPDGAFRNDIRIVSEDGRELAERKTGEIEIRNHAMLVEYWHDPEATAAAFHDGWLRTGDLGYRDEDGYVYIIGRSKEIVRRKGVNIAPAEIESLLREIPGITEAALVGIPSELGDDLAVAAVTVDEAFRMNGCAEAVLTQIRNLVSREKWPDKVVVLDALPRTATHRVEKGVLKEWLTNDK